MNKKQILIESFNLLELQIKQLSRLLSEQKHYIAHVFTLPDTAKGDENNEISEIIVDKVSGTKAIEETITLLNLLFIHHKSDELSNKTAIRLPGVVCIQTNSQGYQQFHQLITEINQLKSTVKNIVTQVEETQRFDFIRESLHGLLTLNTYRTLTDLVDIDTLGFGWANKKVINKITKEALLDKLQYSLESGRCPAHLTREHWQLQLKTEIQLIASLPHDAVLKTQRPVKVQPIARVWDKAQQKQTQFACATPLLVFAVEKTLAEIKIGELPDYHADNIALRNRPRAKPVELLLPRLNLYIER
ncbi:DNA replication terminus site-binding protein [Providencia rettgeri]|uniref:DNA replication terminus site-binding protein n=1 Tax=Providencia TaxID=586 RepID=UPI001C5B2815|nr:MULTISPECIES: DNA replication terminus site-binding protein [Providencia]ELR5229463.1 DNA replication terminus site-binding protein [Providencia rettgeri]QXX84030.1 DNA replication terminus site-binding protein [Providencia sp. R33]